MRKGVDETARVDEDEGCDDPWTLKSEFLAWFEEKKLVDGVEGTGNVDVVWIGDTLLLLLPDENEYCSAGHGRKEVQFDIWNTSIGSFHDSCLHYHSC